MRRSTLLGGAMGLWGATTVISSTEIAASVGLVAWLVSGFLRSFRVGRDELLALALIPFVTALFYFISGESSREVYRDAFYFSRLFLAYAVGAAFARQLSSNLILSAVSVMSIGVAAGLALRVGQAGQYSLNPIWFRDHIHPGAWVFLAVPWLWAMFGCPRSGRRSSTAFWALSLLTMSRVWAAGAIYVVLRFSGARQKTIALLGILLLAILLLPVLSSSSAPASDGYSRTYVEKVVEAGDELLPRAFTREADIHLNWRGYEAFLLMNAIRADFSNGAYFGQGPGAELNLHFDKRVARGANEYSSFGGWFHNGFLAAVYKYGVIGALFVLGWCAFCWSAWWSVVRHSPRGSLLDGCAGTALLALGVMLLGFPFDPIDSPVITAFAAVLISLRRVNVDCLSPIK